MEVDMKDPRQVKLLEKQKKRQAKIDKKENEKKEKERKEAEKIEKKKQEKEEKAMKEADKTFQTQAEKKEKERKEAEKKANALREKETKLKEKEDKKAGIVKKVEIENVPEDDEEAKLEYITPVMDPQTATIQKSKTRFFGLFGGSKDSRGDKESKKLNPKMLKTASTVADFGTQATPQKQPLPVSEISKKEVES